MGAAVTEGRSRRQPAANGLGGDHTRVELSDSRPRAVILLATLVILAVAGCSSANDESANGPVLPTYQPAGPGGFGALLPGELVVEGRCLYLVDGLGVKWLPVFRPDTVSWERDALVLHGERFEIGEHTSLGGGEVPGVSHFLQEPHDSCDVQNIWLVT